MYAERRFTSQDGLSLYYRDYGYRGYGAPDLPGTPVLCLPGLTRNSKDFDRLATWLSTEHETPRRVICPDYRGRGQSDYDSDWDHYSPPVYLSDLRHLMVATNLHRVVVAGTSLGGLLANGMAVLSPGSVAGAILNDIGPDVGGEGLDRIIAFISEDRPQPDIETAAEFLKSTLTTIGLDNDDDWRQLAEGTYRADPPHAPDDGKLHFDWDINLAKPLADKPQTRLDLWALFRGLFRVPVAIIRGGQSDVLSQATAEAMAAAHPNLNLAVIEGKGHTPTLSEPGARAAIAWVLEQADAARAPGTHRLPSPARNGCGPARP